MPRRGGEEQAGIAMGAPVGAQQGQRVGRDRHKAVLGAFAQVDVEHHALAVDVGDLEGERLGQAQAAGIDGREEGIVVQGRDVARTEKTSSRERMQGRRRSRLALRNWKRCQSRCNTLTKKNLMPAWAMRRVAPEPAGNGLTVEEIVFEFGLGDLRRLLSIELGNCRTARV